MRTLARSLRRPYWFHVPSFLLRLLLGEMSTLVLDGWFLQPARLQKDGFQFKFATIESALNSVWRESS
jgi:NAD dependent epimerase/dehydratase family enzyme